jgi:hypothetical protein
MLLAIIFFPLLGSICAGFLGHIVGRLGAAFMTTIIMFINVILTGMLFYKISILQTIYFVNIGT